MAAAVAQALVSFLQLVHCHRSIGTSAAAAAAASSAYRLSRSAAKLACKLAQLSAAAATPEAAISLTDYLFSSAKLCHHSLAGHISSPVFSNNFLPHRVSAFSSSICASFGTFFFLLLLSSPLYSSLSLSLLTTATSIVAQFCRRFLVAFFAELLLQFAFYLCCYRLPLSLSFFFSSVFVVSIVC